LSDVLDGAESYGDWLNGDLYVKTEEQFGICIFPGTFFSFEINPMLIYF